MIKRLFDLSVSIPALLLLSPLMLAAAVWVKLDSSGPVLYSGNRAGRNGRPFGMLKFRSMVTNADRIGGPSTSGDDSRITRSGRFLRRWKLDELPQLLNVARGEMSLVGPRPEVIDKVERYAGRERKVLEARPGITDWASIWNSDEGGVLAGADDADAAYEAVIRPHKINLQIAYVEGHSFGTDLRVLTCTALRVAGIPITPPEIMGYPTFDELRAQVHSLPTVAAA